MMMMMICGGCDKENGSFGKRESDGFGMMEIVGIGRSWEVRR